MNVTEFEYDLFYWGELDQNHFWHSKSFQNCQASSHCQNPLEKSKETQCFPNNLEGLLGRARHLVYQAACDKDSGADYTLSGAMAKLYASEVAMETAVEAVQIHGGNGYVKEYHVERLMRDAKITQIYEGTSEIQRLVIAKSLLK